ncbi:hypothetical protein [Nocardia asiatica]|uniref:hypothetical protein n=1 Tax=Nocardia asiatica TaxID=209252 RepID=UPI003EE0E072
MEDGYPPIRATLPRGAPLRLPDPVDGGSADPSAITVERGSEVDRQRSEVVPVDRLRSLTEPESRFWPRWIR